MPEPNQATFVMKLVFRKTLNGHFESNCIMESFSGNFDKLLSTKTKGYIIS